MDLTEAHKIFRSFSSTHIHDTYGPCTKFARKHIQMYCEIRLERYSKHTSPSLCDKFSDQEYDAVFTIKQHMSNPHTTYGKTFRKHMELNKNSSN